MEPEYISDIIKEVKNNFLLSEDAEITLETNPGTVDKNKLSAFRQTGINRVSIGIQSFDEADLKFLTRIHDAETAIRTVNEARECGFENISIDLIFNLPDQTKEKWSRNLDIAVQLPVNHISAYSLILERGTILNKMVLDGKVTLRDDDFDADLYEYTIGFLEAHRFNQYEVSNFAHDGYESVHNNAYWRYKDYLSFGTSAHSFVDGKRWWNYSPLTFYNNAIEKEGHARIGGETLSGGEMLDEYVMLSFRSKGLDQADLVSRFGSSWINKNKNFLSKLRQENFVIEKNGLLSLTPKGYAVCDEIIGKFV